MGNITELKSEHCNDCIAYEQEWWERCRDCENGSCHLDMDELMADVAAVELASEEDKLKYFPIRWLIKLILKQERKDVDAHFLGIVRKPVGESVKCDTDAPFLFRLFFPSVYVWQHTDGGYTGDDFAGVIYYKLFPFVWLAFEYSC